MPGTTTTQGLTYPVQTDAGKDHAAYLATLAGQLTARFESHSNDLERVRVPPVAVLKWHEPITVITYTHTGAEAGSNILTYNQVLVDTDGMADLSRDNRALYVRRAGYYMIGAYVQTQGTGGSTPTMRLGVHVGAETIDTYSAVYASPAGLNWSSVCLPVAVATLNVPISATIYASALAGTPVNTTIVVEKTLLWAYWLRDL